MWSWHLQITVWILVSEQSSNDRFRVSKNNIPSFIRKGSFLPIFTLFFPYLPPKWNKFGWYITSCNLRILPTSRDIFPKNSIYTPIPPFGQNNKVSYYFHIVYVIRVIFFCHVHLIYVIWMSKSIICFNFCLFYGFVILEHIEEMGQIYPIWLNIMQIRRYCLKSK